MLRFFREELMEHIQDKRCRAQACAGLIRYEVRRLSDRLEQAGNICPTGAIQREPDSTYYIDQKLCIRCDACREIAPESIEVVDITQPESVVEPAGVSE
jgi:ferredoxin